MNNTQFEIIITLELSVIHSLSRINNLKEIIYIEIALQFIKNLKNG